MLGTETNVVQSRRPSGRAGINGKEIRKKHISAQYKNSLPSKEVIQHRRAMNKDQQLHKWGSPHKQELK